MYHYESNMILDLFSTNSMHAMLPENYEYQESFWGEFDGGESVFVSENCL